MFTDLNLLFLKDHDYFNSQQKSVCSINVLRKSIWINDAQMLLMQ